MFSAVLNSNYYNNCSVVLIYYESNLSFTPKIKLDEYIIISHISFLMLIARLFVDVFFFFT